MHFPPLHFPTCKFILRRVLTVLLTQGAARLCVTGGLRAAGYQAWDSVQALCSYVRGMLTSQALLTGVGVGRAARPSLATRGC
jgi:2-keto-3-deoxy-6-phosphogluconate aldolase